MVRRSKSQGYLNREVRISVRCTAVLTEPDGCELAVLITDISREGFRLESRAELVIGEDVTITVGKTEPVRARILWTRGHEAGGVFLDPVDL
jgi:hypothetical protein